MVGALVVLSSAVGWLWIADPFAEEPTPAVSYVEFEVNRGGLRCYLFEERVVLYCEQVQEFED
jgi:hypothetical protein